jgi:hypothetical protein
MNLSVGGNVTPRPKLVGAVGGGEQHLRRHCGRRSENFTYSVGLHRPHRPPAEMSMIYSCRT